jgi:SET domain-containing protein
MIAKKFIQDLEKNIYCRIRPSKIEGIGVFAIRYIPKNTKIFKTIRKTKFTGIDPKLVFSNPRIDEAVKQMVRDFFVVWKGKLYLPNFSLNEIDISFFINYSKKPNVVDKNGEEFFALKGIKKGEELTVDYRNYCDKYKF